MVADSLSKPNLLSLALAPSLSLTLSHISRSTPCRTKACGLAFQRASSFWTSFTARYASGCCCKAACLCLRTLVSGCTACLCYRILVSGYKAAFFFLCDFGEWLQGRLFVFKTLVGGTLWVLATLCSWLVFKR